MATSFKLKRIYAPASHEDGFRVLVDRLWPRGVKRLLAVGPNKPIPVLRISMELASQRVAWGKLLRPEIDLCPAKQLSSNAATATTESTPYRVGYRAPAPAAGVLVCGAC